MCLGDFSTMWFMKLQTKLKHCPHFVVKAKIICVVQNWCFSLDNVDI